MTVSIIDGDALAEVDKEYTLDQSSAIIVSAIPTSKTLITDLKFEYSMTGEEYPIYERLYYEFFE